MRENFILDNPHDVGGCCEAFKMGIWGEGRERMRKEACGRGRKLVKWVSSSFLQVRSKWLKLNDVIGFLGRFILGGYFAVINCTCAPSPSI